MDGQSRLLLTLEEDLRQELEWDVVSSPTFAPPLGASFTSQASTPPALTFVWKLADSSGVPQAQITVRSMGAATEAMLRELWGAPVLSVSVSQKLLGDVRAIASTADGQPLFRTAGNLLQHDFTVEDAAGREVARMHEDWVSARDTYRLEVRNEVDPLAPLVLALVVDREKQ